ncbi:MAG: FAD-binding oxidoreductase [bacterium]|nr:FAD-binding oxidoreductase [bacterium]
MEPRDREIESALKELLDERRVHARAIDRLAWANDASVYRLVPRVVVMPRDDDEIRALFRFSRQRRIPLTFRAAGTSLSGQAVTDGILVVVSRHWRDAKVENDGAQVRVQPGVIGGAVNRMLRPFRRKIGPDPASIDACMLGGILANNSSGMCCGTTQNAYRTLDALRFVLPDGTTVDTEYPTADADLSRAAPDIVAGLLELKRNIEHDDSLAQRIRRKYSLKNTMGYSLNSFLDFERPVDILSHLMIGSEGTLGFISEAVLRTVPDDPCRYTGLLFFEDVPRACASIESLRASGARALELMDRASLSAVETQPGLPGSIRDLPAQGAALLIEYQCRDETELQQAIDACRVQVQSLPLAAAPELTRDPERQALLWRVRKGLIPSVGAMRRRGTSFIIEDVVFPVDRLARGVSELQGLFADYGYDDAILFGHAKDGNLHFVLTQAFDNAADVERYDGFMRRLARLVAGRHGGALKAEHGTGRNMTPFLAYEWGDRAHAAMLRIKRLIDPDGLVNPGVIFNDDPRAHVAHLKELPEVESEVDRCIECGFCERLCPSRDLTLTPRQRIVVRREMSRLRVEDPDGGVLRELESDYVYEAIETCAADGLCALGCPVGIDTGALVKRLRRERHPAARSELTAVAAGRFELLERGARFALRAAGAAELLVGQHGLAAVARAARSALGRSIPDWAGALPRAATRRTTSAARRDAAAIYLPSCVSRVVAEQSSASGALPDTVLRVAGKAGVRLWIPPDAAGHCCGLPFGSKGYGRASRVAATRTVDALHRWSDGGRLPVLIDSSPCAQALKCAGPDLDAGSRSRHGALTVLDGVEFAHDVLLAALRPRRLPGVRVAHATCSVRRMQLTSKLEALIGACSEESRVPQTESCCGFAGDRGLMHPELTRAATRDSARELNRGDECGHYSSSRTCEIGLTRATGQSFRSFWQLLDEATS